MRPHPSWPNPLFVKEPPSYLGDCKYNDTIVNVVKSRNDFGDLQHKERNMSVVFLSLQEIFRSNHAFKDENRFVHEVTNNIEKAKDPLEDLFETGILPYTENIH